jgi:hypothetical protein
MSRLFGWTLTIIIGPIIALLIGTYVYEQIIKPRLPREDLNKTEAVQKSDLKPMPVGRGPLVGRPGRDEDWNATWLDLDTPADIMAGSVLLVRFAGVHPNEVIMRLVPTSCTSTARCLIPRLEDKCATFVIENGQLSITVGRSYSGIRQISFHSGVRGNAWDCKVNGGPISQLAEISVLGN